VAADLAWSRRRLAPTQLAARLKEIEILETEKPPKLTD